MNGYISVKDDTPDDERDVLCWVQKLGERPGYSLVLYYDNNQWWNDFDDIPFESNPDHHLITYWREIDSPFKSRWKLLD